MDRLRRADKSGLAALSRASDERRRHVAMVDLFVMSLYTVWPVPVNKPSTIGSEDFRDLVFTYLKSQER